MVKQSHLTLVHSQSNVPVIIGPDSFLWRPDGGAKYEWTPTRLKEAWGKAQAAFIKAVKAFPPQVILMCGLPGSGKSTWLRENALSGQVYFDSTLTQKWQRRWFLNATSQFNIPTKCIWIDTPCPILIERNDNRPKERHLPTRKLLAMFEDFEPPTLSEGFFSIIKVPYTAETAYLGGPFGAA